MSTIAIEIYGGKDSERDLIAETIKRALIASEISVSYAEVELRGERDIHVQILNYTSLFEEDEK